jgi:hypothetical protein
MSRQNPDSHGCRTPTVSAPHVIAREVVNNLEAALEQSREIAEDLEEKNAATPSPIPKS